MNSINPSSAIEMALIEEGLESLSAVARQAGLSPRSLGRLCLGGKIEAVRRRGGKWFTTRAAVARYYAGERLAERVPAVDTERARRVAAAMRRVAAM